jgi:hypothetical protein
MLNLSQRGIVLYSKLKVLSNQILYQLGINADTTVSEGEIKVLLDLLKVVEVSVSSVRIGSEYDGGYVVPNVLDDIEYCFSFGVSDNCELESQMANFGMQVFAIDGSIEELPTKNENINFTKKYIGRDYTPDYIGINEWVSGCIKNKGSLLFAMDIEESEWETILDLDSVILDIVDLFVVEFHGFHLLPQKSFFKKVKNALLKLDGLFVVTNVNFNNTAPSLKLPNIGSVPSVLEVTYLARRVMNENDIHIVDELSIERVNLNRSNDPSIPAIERW